MNAAIGMIFWAGRVKEGSILIRRGRLCILNWDQWMGWKESGFRIRLRAGSRCAMLGRTNVDVVDTPECFIAA